MSRRNGVFVAQWTHKRVEKGEGRRAEHERENAGFQAATVNRNVEGIH